MRSKVEMMAHMPFALINCLLFSAAFVWIYCQGRSSKPWFGQGLRFGLAVWVISQVYQYITNYVIEPWPGMFVAKILTWELVAALLLGLLVAGLSKNDGAVQASKAGA
jgi:riboflavin transporter FmnP